MKLILHDIIEMITLDNVCKTFCIVNSQQVLALIILKLEEDLHMTIKPD